MRLLICGSREWWDRVPIDEIVSDLHYRFCIREIIHGGAPGADTLAGEVAEALGIPVDAYKADWDKYRRHRHNPAGAIRNQKMLDEGRPNRVLAFSYYAQTRGGTKDMVDRAYAAGLPVCVAWCRGQELIWRQRESFGFKGMNGAKRQYRL